MSSYLLMMANAPVSVKAELQNADSHVNNEAELVAAALAMIEIVFCSNMVTKLGFEAESKTAPLNIDSTSTLFVVGNRTYCTRTNTWPCGFSASAGRLKGARLALTTYQRKINSLTIGSNTSTNNVTVS